MKMMTLLKQQINVAFHLSAFRWYLKHDKKKVAGGAAIAAVVVLSIAPIYFFFYLNMIETALFGGLSIGQPEIVLSLALVMISFFVLFFGIAFVMSTFYFSQDLSVLIPLPFAPREIIGAKFAVVLVQEYLTVIPLMLPVIIIYGAQMGEGPYFWLAGLLVMLMAPIIPLTIVSAAVLLIMRVTNLGRRKDFLRLLGMILLVVLLVGVNAVFTKLVPMSQEEIMALLFADEGLVRFITRLFPPALIATRAMTASGLSALFNLVFFALLNVVGVFVTLFLGDRLFFRGLIGGEEITARKDISAGQLQKKMSASSSPVRAIAMKEIKMLMRTPIYLFNSVGVLVIAPIAMLVPLIAGDAAEPLLQLFQQTDAGILVNLAGAAFIGAMAAFAPAASSSFSREGRQFWISQIIPVSPVRQIHAKILYSLILSLLAVPLVILLSVLIAKWTLAELIIVILLGLCISFPSITASLLVDLINPYLTWDNPQKAIKQNVNVVLGMVATAGLYYLLYLFTMYLYKAGYGEAMVYAGAAAASLLLGVIPYLVMVKIADNRYQKIMAP